MQGGITHCDTGSPILSREGWRALLQEQGFSPVVVVGESKPAPALLSRQSVVLGVSDGAIRIARQSPAKARAAARAPPSAVKVLWLLLLLLLLLLARLAHLHAERPNESRALMFT
jgi:hypothetical protein